MKYVNKVLGFILILGTVSVQSQIISDYLTEVDYNVNIDYENSVFSIFTNQVMIDEIGTMTGTESPAVITNIRGPRVDGYHKDQEGFRYFSFDADTRVNGSTVSKSDIIRCNDLACSSTIYFFDANIEDLKHININAFTLDPDNGELLFSIESAAVINSISFLPSDIIRFNSEGDYVLEYDSLFTGDDFARYKNIDGLTLLPNGYYIVSFVNEGVFHEIFEYNPPLDTWAAAYTPLSVGNNYGNINITSLMGFENDLIFKNGFD